MSNIPLADVILRGIRGAQPSAASVCAGSLYYVTDELVTERSNGTVWQDYTDAASTILVLISSEVVTADTASVNFTGLDGNVDLSYLLVGVIKNNSGLQCRYDWQPNGIATNQASFIGATSYSTLVLADVPSGGYATFQAVIDGQNNPNSIAFPRTYTGTTVATTTTPTASGGAIGGIWTDNSTNITGITVAANQTNGIGDGSTLILFRLGS